MLVNNGIFIAVESVDPVDTDIYSDMIYNWLLTLNIKASLITDPHGCIESGKTIHEVISQSDNFKAFDKAGIESLLRSVYLDTVVTPLLQAGTWVIVKGFIDDTYCSVITQGGVTYRNLLKLNDILLSGKVLPDVVFVIDTSFSVSYKRARDQVTSVLSEYERNLRTVYNRKRTELLIRAAAQPKSHIVVDFSGDSDYTAATIKDYLLRMGTINVPKSSPVTQGIV